MKTTKIAIITALLFNFLVANTTKAPKTEYEKIKLGLNGEHSMRFAGIYMAKKLGLFKKAGYDVELINATSKKIKKLILNKTLQIGISDSSVIGDYDRGKPFVISAAIFQRSSHAMIYSKANPKFHKSRNNRVLTYYFEGDHLPFAIESMLKEHNTKIKRYPNEENQSKAQLLKEGKVDFIIDYDFNKDILEQQTKMNLRFMLPADFGIVSYGDMLIVHKDNARKHYEKIKQIEQAIKQGWLYALHNWDTSANHINNHYNLNIPKNIQRELIEDVIEKIMVDIVPIGTLQDKKLEAVHQQCIEHLICAGNVDISHIKIKFHEFSEMMVYFFQGISIFMLLVCLVSIFKLRKKIKIKNKELKEFNNFIDKHLMVFRSDLRGDVNFVTSLFKKKIGVDDEELSNAVKENLINNTDFRVSIINEIKWRGNIEYTNKKTGEELSLEITASPKKNEKNEYSFICNIVDVSDKKIIQEMSITDELTKLYNRKKLNQTLQELFLKYIAKKAEFCILLMDLDKFKNCNDTYGHSFGDEVLQKTANALKTTLQNRGIVGRWGGEEFIIILPKTKQKDAFEICEELRISINEIAYSNGYVSSGSFGIAQIERDRSVENLIKCADEALYRAKEKGRNRSEVYT